MKKLLEVSDLYLESHNKILLNHVSLTFYKGISTFICGTSASGKTCLLKRIAGLGKCRGHIKKYGRVEVILDSQEQDGSSIVKDFLNYSHLEKKEQSVILKFLSKTLLDKKIDQLDEKNKVLVSLCQSFLRKPDLLIIDNLLHFLDQKSLQKFYDYVQKKAITLVCVSTDIESVLAFHYMVVMDKGSIAIEGKTLQVLKQEKLLKRLGIGLPFYVDLSLQLKLYGLIDQVYVKKEDLRGALWK